MAWVKIPQENHPLFRDCLPRDPRVSTVNMFGGVAAKVNGQMFAGLFARGAVAKPSASDQKVALAIDGAIAPRDHRLRSSPVKYRALRPGVEPQQRRGQDERADTPEEEVSVRQQQSKESNEDKNGQREAPHGENRDAVRQ